MKNYLSIGLIALAVTILSWGAVGHRISPKLIPSSVICLADRAFWLRNNFELFHQIELVPLNVKRKLFRMQKISHNVAAFSSPHLNPSV